MRRSRRELKEVAISRKDWCKLVKPYVPMGIEKANDQGGGEEEEEEVVEGRA